MGWGGRGGGGGAGGGCGIGEGGGGPGGPGGAGDSTKKNVVVGLNLLFDAAIDESRGTFPDIVP